MAEITVGVIVGVIVALAGQLIVYLSNRIRDRIEERRRARDVIRLLRHEVEHHLAQYEHHLHWIQESIEKGGEAHTGYSYEGVKTDAYDKIFLAYWYLLPDEVLKPVMAYYGVVHTVNILSGSFVKPTPVPIIEAREAMERARRSAHELVELLGNYLSTL